VLRMSERTIFVYQAGAVESFQITEPPGQWIVEKLLPVAP